MLLKSKQTDLQKDIVCYELNLILLSLSWSTGGLKFSEKKPLAKSQNLEID